ncbi:hypothetical protein [Streptomyces sp. NPDC046862]|uniref:hypothetical protein n=1 Tax=Streptomyces sp. NPDC046862 TaxID=3154603 RepID=UPI003456AE9C
MDTAWRIRPPQPQARRPRVGKGGLACLAAVAAAFTVAQLLFVALRVDLGWDETVYVSQVTPHIPAAFFSAPRARGVPVLVAPLAALTSSTHALRVYLAVLSGVGLFLALAVWRKLLPTPVPALAGVLFAGLWTTQLYGPQAMPNLWVAFGALAAVGCFLRAATDRADRRALAGLGLALAVVTLFRPADAAWLALPLAAATVWVRRWRRSALFAVMAAGLALGGAQWVVEAYTSYGGIAARLHRSNAIEGGIGWHLAVDDQLRTLDGSDELCRPCDVPWRHHADAIWWFLLPVLTAAGLAAATRARRLTTALFPALCAICVSVPYLFLIDYAAPRFLLPAYALLSLPIADFLTHLVTAARPAWRPATTTLVAALVVVQLLGQHLVLTRAVHIAAATNADYARIATDLQALGVRQPCLITGRLATPVAYHAHCTSAQTHGHNADTTRGQILSIAQREQVAVLVRPHHHPPHYARTWTPYPLRGLREHAGYHVYLPPH